MALLIAFVNIIGWGLIPLTVKDSPQSQIAGMGIGASATVLIIYLFSVKQNGVTNAFIYSQLCSVISTFGGIWFLHEEKSKREMTYIIIGLIFIVGGSILTGFAK